MSESSFDRGMATRRSILGDAHVDRAEAQKTAFDADFQRFITEAAWGTAWQGDALDLKTRHLITIGLLAALGREHELALHLRATKNSGVNFEELKALFMHVAIYAGIPAANTAFAIAKKQLAQE